MRSTARHRVLLAITGTSPAINKTRSTACGSGFFFVVNSGMNQPEPSVRRIGAIDIGGTSMKYGVVTEHGEVVWEQSVPTKASEGRDAVVARCCAVVRTIIDHTPEVVAIGVGVPGVVDPLTKMVQAPPNLPGWDCVDLRGALQQVTSLPIDVENDANAAEGDAEAPTDDSAPAAE